MIKKSSFLIIECLALCVHFTGLFPPQLIVMVYKGEESMEWYIEINSEFCEIDRAEKELTVFLHTIYKEQNQRLFFILSLAFRELLLNAVEHGNAMNRNKKVRCHVKCQEDTIIFDVYDTGAGFVPMAHDDSKEDASRERQRGIHILRSMGLMIQVDGNHVQASFKIE